MPIGWRGRQPASLTLRGNARSDCGPGPARAAEKSWVSSGPTGALASGTRGAEAMLTAPALGGQASRPQ